VTVPTGGGKTLVMKMVAERALKRGGSVVIYANRRALIDQMSDKMIEYGLYHGVRAAGYEDEREHRFQISSIQTEAARVLRSKKWTLHDATTVLVDEGHLHTTGAAKKILDAHVGSGAKVGLFTATPIQMATVADELVIGATISELRECGALVVADVFGPDEPDMRAFKASKLRPDGSTVGMSEAAIRKAVMTPTIFGRVWEWYDRLNPQRMPGILFAPGVNESLWFAEKFCEKGVNAAHLDGDNVWVDGELHKSDSTIRGQVLADSKSGRIKVLTNRFVLREGIDAPWLRHGILATMFSSVQSYIQSVGRLMRATEGKDRCLIQDHGGNWWRWGSPNEDRAWTIHDTPSSAFGLRAERLRKSPDAEPYRCPRCGRIWGRGSRCNPAIGGCGFEFDRRLRSRPVVGTDGTLRELTGNVFKPRAILRTFDAVDRWRKMYYRSRNKGRSFNAAAALFAYENNWQWPDRSWPLMPLNEHDWFRKVGDVPTHLLTT
jgi:superfamily II DNA or RNA helicase